LRRGRVLEAALRSDDLVALAQRLGDEEYVLQAHHSRWTNFYGIGDARISRADTLVGIRLYDREKHRHHRHVYGAHDPGVCACGTGANAVWLCGYADEAMDLAEQAVAVGTEIEHPLSQIIASMWAILACHGIRNYAAAREHAETLQQLCDRYARVLLPEIERLHAEVLLLTGQIDAPQAIARIVAAAALARQQVAVMLEWRAAMALAPLYSGAGRDAEARELLRTHYAAFTQGFTTPDLVEGKKLLDSMN
jgi:hypothetical protein